MENTFLYALIRSQVFYFSSPFDKPVLTLDRGEAVLRRSRVVISHSTREVDAGRDRTAQRIEGGDGWRCCAADDSQEREGAG